MRFKYACTIVFHLSSTRLNCFSYNFIGQTLILLEIYCTTRSLSGISFGSVSSCLIRFSIPTRSNSLSYKAVVTVTVCEFKSRIGGKSSSQIDNVLVYSKESLSSQ